MAEFFRSDQERKTYKLDPAAEVCYVYYIHVASNGHDFTHARGRYHVADLAAAKALMKTLGATPAVEQDYINAMKDYFAIDKRVREQFIEKYNLK